MGSGISDAKGSWDSLFGKKDPSATNSVLNGQVVATGTPGAQVVADPNQGLGSSQARNRGLGAAGGRLLGGLSQQDQQQQPSQQTPINFAPPQQNLSQYFTPKRNAFFGQ